MSQNDAFAAPGKQLEQFVIFSLEHEEYAVPVLSVIEIVATMEITPFPNAPDYILGLTNLRGKILPVLDLEKRFRLGSTDVQTRTHIMVAESEEKVQFGLLVDQVSAVMSVPTSSIQPPPSVLKTKIGANYLPGVIVLRNDTAHSDRIILILDMPKILSDKNIRQIHEIIPADTQYQVTHKEAT